MNQHKRGPIVIGVDVGGPQKGCHAVARDSFSESSPLGWGRRKCTESYFLLHCLHSSFADQRFSEKCEPNDDIFNSASQYAPDNLLKLEQTYVPDNSFNPVSRVDPGNPVNSTNRHVPTIHLIPPNRYNPDNPLNPANRYNLTTPFQPLTASRNNREPVPLPFPYAGLFVSSHAVLLEGPGHHVSYSAACYAPDRGLRMMSRLFPEGVQTIMETSTMVVA